MIKVSLTKSKLTSINNVLGPKQDGRMILDELNGKIEEARAKGVEDDTANRRANEATGSKGYCLVYFRI